MLSDPRSPAAEAYRTLRTNIQFSSLDKPVRTLLVTSARPNEGKSLAVANLALTFAQMGSTVALVDADLRRPALHFLFGLSNETGLTSFILNAGKASNNGKATGQIPFTLSDIPNLKLLTSGPLPPNSAEVLGSSRMSELIDRLKDEADYVLFDAPPVLALTDAAVLATKVDGTLLVLKAGKTSRDDAREAKEQLQKVRANLLGVVLNEVKQGNAKYRY
ncbi:MAG: CpsD/CapB family tyrosine-protein kinase [Chloroflexi bacterium]|nr:CpsD/CapB family tyrosine-protein kinase [Chloroflexota bacterium]